MCVREHADLWCRKQQLCHCKTIEDSRRYCKHTHVHSFGTCPQTPVRLRQGTPFLLHCWKKRTHWVTHPSGLTSHPDRASYILFSKVGTEKKEKRNKAQGRQQRQDTGYKSVMYVSVPCVRFMKLRGGQKREKCVRCVCTTRTSARSPHVSRAAILQSLHYCCKENDRFPGWLVLAYSLPAVCNRHETMALSASVHL